MAVKMKQQLFTGAENRSSIREVRIRAYYREAKDMFDLYKDPSAAIEAFRNLDDLFVQVADKGMMEHTKLDFDNLTEEDVKGLFTSVNAFMDLFPFRHIVAENSFDKYLRNYISERLDMDLDRIPEWILFDLDGTIANMKTIYTKLGVDGEYYWFQHDELE